MALTDRLEMQVRDAGGAVPCRSVVADDSNLYQYVSRQRGRLESVRGAPWSGHASGPGISQCLPFLIARLPLRCRRR